MAEALVSDDGFLRVVDAALEFAKICFSHELEGLDTGGHGVSVTVGGLVEMFLVHFIGVS